MKRALWTTTGTQGGKGRSGGSLLARSHAVCAQLCHAWLTPSPANLSFRSHGLVGWTPELREL